MGLALWIFDSIALRYVRITISYVVDEFNCTVIVGVENGDPERLRVGEGKCFHFSAVCKLKR